MQDKTNMTFVSNDTNSGQLSVERSAGDSTSTTAAESASLLRSVAIAPDHFTTIVDQLGCGTKLPTAVTFDVAAINKPLSQTSTIMMNTIDVDTLRKLFQLRDEELNDIPTRWISADKHVYYYGSCAFTGRGALNVSELGKHLRTHFEHIAKHGATHLNITLSMMAL